MWKLHRIVAENLCAFRELDYFLSQGVTTLVFGNNRDNESQQSNGSGKSALIECIAVGLTGSPLRKIKTKKSLMIRQTSAGYSCNLPMTAATKYSTLNASYSAKGLPS